jgi:hypothetical protein
MFTNIVPSGVSLRIVVPRSLSGRARLARRWRFSASTSNSVFFVRSSSARSSAIVPWSSPSSRDATRPLASLGAASALRA